MANPKRRVAANVPGDFFVDSTSINCDTCRQLAPSVFGEASDSSFVKAQPNSNEVRREALQAVLACPTGSIGCPGEDDVKTVMQNFPLVIDEPVFYCGYNSPKSCGGNSFFIQAPLGNWLVGTPKFIAPIVQGLESLVGVDHIFLTHRDDVAEAELFAKHFGILVASRPVVSQYMPDAKFVAVSNDPTKPTSEHQSTGCCDDLRRRDDGGCCSNCSIRRRSWPV